MKAVKYFLILAIAILGFSIGNVQAQDFSRNGKSVQTIERKVFKELIKLPHYGVFDSLKYQVDGDTVTLYGKVVRSLTKKQAENSVEDIEGVRNVVNNIQVLPLSGFDDSIRCQTLRTFAGKGLYRYLWEPNPSVRIVVDRGRIQLEGYVANKGDYNLMNILANSMNGVFGVENNLVVGKELAR
jgi:osmotically-inducible protein OsmY